MAPDLPLRIGVLGLGMAGGVMVSVIGNHPRLTLTAAADLNPVLRERFARDHGAAVEESAEALFARADIDAVYIATPAQLHADHAVGAARQGKHVVVEKPMALSLSDCDRMLVASRSAGTVLMVGHTHGYDPAVRALRAMIERGELGRPVLLNAFNYTNFMYRPRRPDELKPGPGGGVLWNQTPHQVDVARCIVGEPVRSVRAMTATLDPARKVEGCCSAFIEFASGATANLIYSGYDRFDSDEWHGWTSASGGPKAPSHGAAQRALSSLDGEEELSERQTRWSYGGDKLAALASGGQPHFGELIVGCEKGEARTTAAGLTIYTRAGAREIELPEGPPRPSHRLLWDEFYAAVREGRPAVMDGLFGRRTVEVCLAIADSSRNRREVTLNAASAARAGAA